MHNVLDWTDLVMALLTLAAAITAFVYGREKKRPFLLAMVVPFCWFEVYYLLSIVDVVNDFSDVHVVVMRPALAMFLVFFILNTARDRVERAVAWWVNRL